MHETRQLDAQQHSGLPERVGLRPKGGCLMTFTVLVPKGLKHGVLKVKVVLVARGQGEVQLLRLLTFLSPPPRSFGGVLHTNNYQARPTIPALLLDSRNPYVKSNPTVCKGETSDQVSENQFSPTLNTQPTQVQTSTVSINR